MRVRCTFPTLMEMLSYQDFVNQQLNSPKLTPEKADNPTCT